MPIKIYKPTSPARRYHTVLVNDDITTSKPHKPLCEKLDQSGDATITASSRPGGAAAATSGCTGSSISSATSTTSREGRDDRIRPEPLGAHRADHVCRRREALHPAARGHEGGRQHHRRRQRRHSAGQCASAEEHPAGHDAPQRGVEAGQGRTDRAQRRLVGAAGREGRRLRVGEDAVGRDSPHRDCVLRHLGQVGNLDHENVSIGKPGATAGSATARTSAAS